MVVPPVAPLAAACLLGTLAYRLRAYMLLFLAAGQCVGVLAAAIPAAVSLQVAAREIWRATSAGQTVPAEPQGDASPDLS